MDGDHPHLRLFCAPTKSHISQVWTFVEGGSLRLHSETTPPAPIRFDLVTGPALIGRFVHFGCWLAKGKFLVVVRAGHQRQRRLCPLEAATR